MAQEICPRCGMMVNCYRNGRHDAYCQSLPVPVELAKAYLEDDRMLTGWVKANGLGSVSSVKKRLDFGLVLLGYDPEQIHRQRRDRKPKSDKYTRIHCECGVLLTFADVGLGQCHFCVEENSGLDYLSVTAVFGGRGRTSVHGRVVHPGYSYG